MAAGLARSILGETAVIESCGLETADGRPANCKAVEVMNEIGLDIANHRTKDISAVQASFFDLVVALTPGIAAKLKGRGITDIVNLDVADPYGKDVTVYRDVRDQLTAELRVLLEKPL